jgi:hypothetical protein
MSSNAITYGLRRYIQDLKERVKDRPIAEQIRFFERRYRRSKRANDGVGNAAARSFDSIIDELRSGRE